MKILDRYVITTFIKNYFIAFFVLVGLYIRLRILETPAFRRVKEEGRISHVPVLEVFRQYWREIILTALLRSCEQAPFYIFTTFILSYGVKTLGLSSGLLNLGIIITAVFSFVMMPTYSSISDRVGRKRWYLIGCVQMAAWAFPYFILLQTKIAVVVVITMILSVSLFHDWLYGPQAALIAERFGTRLRYSGASIGYQLASITAGENFLRKIRNFQNFRLRRFFLEIGHHVFDQLAVIFFERRLGIKGVDLRRPAFRENVNHAFGSGREMRRLRS